MGPPLVGMTASGFGFAYLRVLIPGVLLRMFNIAAETSPSGVFVVTVGAVLWAFVFLFLGGFAVISDFCLFSFSFLNRAKVFKGIVSSSGFSNLLSYSRTVLVAGTAGGSTTISFSYFSSSIIFLVFLNLAWRYSLIRDSD